MFYFFNNVKAHYIHTVPLKTVLDLVHSQLPFKILSELPSQKQGRNSVIMH